MAHAHPLAVPRAWLIVVTALVIVPWLIVGAIYLYDPEDTARVNAAGAPAETTAGPWGELLLTPIVISPPMEYVPQNWGPLEPTLWHMPASTPDELRAFPSSTGLGAEDIARLQARARPHPQAGGLLVEPPADLVRRMPADVRARLYLPIARSPLNVDQQTAFRFFGTSPDAWLGTLISPLTRDLVKPYIYHYGGFMYFADVESVRSEIRDPAELQRLAKALYRQATLLVTVRVDDPADVSTATEYWGRGGRRTDVRPLLESIVDSPPDRSIDISHLLPSLAREHLYRYPRVTVADHEQPVLANCLWTALNFFDPTPDDRFLDVQVALEHLKTDYYIVHDGYQLGDVVAFSDRAGNLFHVAVYLAGGLVFGKNGITPMAPWSILPIERLKGHYVEDSEDWQVTFHRSNVL